MSLQKSTEAGRSGAYRMTVNAALAWLSPIQRHGGASSAADQPADKEIVGDEEFMTRLVTLNWSGEPGEGLPSQLRAFFAFFRGEPGQAVKHAVG